LYYYKDMKLETNLFNSSDANFKVILIVYTNVYCICIVYKYMYPNTLYNSVMLYQLYRIL